MSESYHIGDWLVEPSLQRISKNKVTKKLEPQLMAVLQQLAARPGEVVTKDDLKETVWADVIVTENVLTRAISSLRKALEDDRFNPKYIETISKTGYRLIAPVKVQERSKGSETFTIKLSRKPVVMVVGIVVLIALGAFVTRQIFLPISAEKVYNPVAVANYTNSEYWPSISPDGRFVAYGWKGEADDNWDIYAKLIGTETILRITDNPSTDLRARWSSDGNYIYYLRYEKGGSTIYKKPVVGGEEVRILTSPGYSFGNFDISPDEKWISFNDRESPSDPLRIKLISLETGLEKWMTSPDKNFNGDIHPTFSPDGTKLAFVREKNSVSMYLWSLDLTSEEPDQITKEHLSINGFDWSSNSNSLFYGADKTGLYKLWEVSLDSKKPTLVAVGDYQMVMPRVAETGRIIYSKMKDNVNIWSYNLESKTSKTWRATNDLNLNPVVSPDGVKACFTTNKDGTFQIWISNSDGTDAVPITNFIGQYLNAPRWSPDGESIVFQGFLDGQADIYKVNARGGVPENLTDSDADDHTPIYANNDEIYFSSDRDGDWAIWKMRADGARATKIVEDNAYAPQLSPYKSVLFYSKKGTFGLWSYDLEKQEEKLLIEAFHPMYWGAFAVAEKGIYYLNAQHSRFEFFDFESEESSFVYQPREKIARLGISMSLSPDTNQLLFSQIDHNDADVMLLEIQQ